MLKNGEINEIVECIKDDYTYSTYVKLAKTLPDNLKNKWNYGSCLRKGNLGIIVATLIHPYNTRKVYVIQRQNKLYIVDEEGLWHYE